MTKEVVINIKGLQFSENDSEEVELSTTGTYHCRDGNRYIKYDEVFEDIEDKASNLVTIKGDIVEVRKTGVIESHMVFEKNRKTTSPYQTPYGILHMNIATKNLQIKEAQDSLELQIDYILEVGDQHVADCSLVLLAKSR